MYVFVLLVSCAADLPATAHGPAALPAPSATPKSIGGSSTALSATPDGGFAVVGDVNNDGRDDLVAVSGGTAEVFMGRPYGVTPTPITTLTAAFGSGTQVAGLGDVNGDGYDDVAIGDPTANAGAGRVLVYHGGRRGLNPRSARTLAGRGSEALGAEISRAGDMNGDGYDDIAVYAPGPKRVRVYYGSATGISTTGYSSITAEWHDVSTITSDGSPVTGQGLAGGSDLDGDGYSDIVVGYPTWNGVDGAFYVYRGSSTGVRRFGTLITHPYPDYYSSWCYGAPYMGWSLSTGFDLDGDGYDEVMAGAPFDICDGYGYGWFGGAGGIDTSSWVEFYAYGGDYLSLFPASSAGGDFNGDGLGDLAFGGYAASYAEGPFDISDATVETWTDPTALSGTEQYLSSYYYDIATATRVSTGDVNGDGYDDVAVTYTTKAGWTSAVYFGAP